MACWQCGRPLRAEPEPEPDPEPVHTGATAKAANGLGARLGSLLNRQPPPPPSPASDKPLIQFEPGASSEDQPARRMAMTMTGEMVEVEEEPAAPSVLPSQSHLPVQPAPVEPAAAQIGESRIEGAAEDLITLTFCKNCGYDNPEGVMECVRCKAMLERVPFGSVKEIEPLPRAWGFDALGLVWMALGFAAVFCGQFLVKADTSTRHATWADYFWTGIVVCAPGIFIFMRHHFCKLLFWVMTLGSALVWAVIGFIWLFVGLRISDEGTIALEWLAALSFLSLVSYITVRQNDAFDYAA